MQNEDNIYSLLMPNKEWLQKYGLQGCNINLRSLATEVRNRSVNPEKRLPVSEVRYPGIDANQDRLNQQYQKEKDEPPVAMQVQIVRELIYKRLAWTTTSSRKIFGILPGDCVILMLAVSTSNILAFYHFIEDVISLLVEQIANKKYFNIISYTDEGERTFQSTITPVTNGSLAEARAWLQHLPRPSRDVSIQPSLVFFEDEKVDNLVVLTNRISSNVLKELGEDSSTKVTVCWYDTGEEADSEVLKYVRVHWYKSVAAIVKLENNNLPLATEVHPRKTLNGDFQHTRDGDVFESDEVKLLVEEIRDCGDILRVLKQAGSLQEKTTASESDIVCETKPPFGAEVKHWLKGVSTTSSSRLSRDTKYIANELRLTEDNKDEPSSSWLSKHGLLSLGLRFSDALLKASFPHCKSSSRKNQKFVEATYCSSFPHVQLTDGSIVHVHMTSDLFRKYKLNMEAALDNFEERISWLLRGTRSSFGIVKEHRLYVLLDTSDSMEYMLRDVKLQVEEFLEEQVCGRFFNLVCFKSFPLKWRHSLVEATPEALQSARGWMWSQEAGGSSNLLAALTCVFADPSAQAAYLVSDGRCNEVQEELLTTLQAQRAVVPVNIVCCSLHDVTAANLLHSIAVTTGGMFHYLDPATRNGNWPKKYESEDVQLLVEEIHAGRRYLEMTQSLLVQCQQVSSQQKKQESRRLKLPTKNSFKTRNYQTNPNPNKKRFTLKYRGRKKKQSDLTIQPSWDLSNTQMSVSSRANQETKYLLRSANLHNGKECQFAPVVSPFKFKAVEFPNKDAGRGQLEVESPGSTEDVETLKLVSETSDTLSQEQSLPDRFGSSVENISQSTPEFNDNRLNETKIKKERKHISKQKKNKKQRERSTSRAGKRDVVINGKPRLNCKTKEQTKCLKRGQNISTDGKLSKNSSPRNSSGYISISSLSQTSTPTKYRSSSTPSLQSPDCSSRHVKQKRSARAGANKDYLCEGKLLRCSNPSVMRPSLDSPQTASQNCTRFSSKGSESSEPLKRTDQSEKKKTNI